MIFTRRVFEEDQENDNRMIEFDNNSSHGKIGLAPQNDDSIIILGLNKQSK